MKNLRYYGIGLLIGLVLSLIFSIRQCSSNKEKLQYMAEDFDSISDYTAGIELELKNVENKLTDCGNTSVLLKKQALDAAQRLDAAQGKITSIQREKQTTKTVVKYDTLYFEYPMDLVSFKGLAVNNDYQVYYKGEFVGLLPDDSSLRLYIDSVLLVNEPIVQIIKPNEAEVEQQKQRIDELIKTNNELGQSLARVSEAANAFHRWEVEAGVGAISNYASIDRVPQYGPMGVLQFNVTKGLRLRGQYLYNWDRKNQEDAHVLQASLMVKLFGIHKKH